ncbi:hypothetical protein [Amycolatopsis sp. NBRC 101858]|nr:hypothetical protein [Amycolatopsis sp. NBRC 101858]
MTTGGKHRVDPLITRVDPAITRVGPTITRQATRPGPDDEEQQT